MKIFNFQTTNTPTGYISCFSQYIPCRGILSSVIIDIFYHLSFNYYILSYTKSLSCQAFSKHLIFTFSIKKTLPAYIPAGFYPAFTRFSSSSQCTFANNQHIQDFGTFPFRVYQKSLQHRSHCTLSLSYNIKCFLVCVI